MTKYTNYYFIPSLRQGMAAAIPEIDEQGNPAVFARRAHFSVDVEVSGTGFSAAEVLQKEIELYGPGDIIGFERRTVARTDPHYNVCDFEPNYFPFIEFADADFPWRYTPKHFNSNTGNLEPWITLIVLIGETVETTDEQIDKEFIEGDRKKTQQKPFITVSKQTSLPDCNQSKWWTHVQLTADNSLLTGDEDSFPDHNDLLDELNRAIRNNPEQVASRILCPRRLRPGVKYCAFVVPTFELARIATGLAPRNLGDGIELNGITPAWNNSSSDPIDLPYYYKWEFRTSMQGDFEHLVRLLEPRELTGLGKRKLDCSNPGYGLTNFTRIEAEIPEDHADYRVIEMEGALQSIDITYMLWGKDFDDPNNDPHVFQTDLAEKLLNRPKADEEEANDEQPVVGPPVYGRWHRGRKATDSMYVRPGSENTGWLDELNLDPRHRVVSGFGTEVVIKQQEELMAAAWDQLGAVDEANEQLRRAQLAREVSCCTEKRLRSLTLSDYIRSTAPFNQRVKDHTTGNTLEVTFRESRIPEAILDPAFRRISRKRGSIRKRQRFDGQLRSDILQRFNEDSIHPAGPHPTPGGMVDICDLTNRLIESISFVNEPPQFKSAPPRSQPPGSFVYNVEVTPPESGQIVEVEVGPAQGNTPVPLEILSCVKLNASNWRLTCNIPQIPISGGGNGGTVTPGGGVTDPGGGVTDPGGVVVPGTGDPWNHEFFFFTVTLRATDNGSPPRTSIQTISGQASAGTNQWFVTTVNEEVPPVFPDFPSERRFCTRNITVELLNRPEIKSGLSAENLTVLNAVIEMMDGFLASEDHPISKPNVDLPALKQKLIEALNPEVTIPKRVLKRINMQDVTRRGDILDRIMAAPEFPQPMYEPLRDISQDLLLPGLEKVPQNTISLLKTNSRFIESYMVGLNHEFSRELLWREYPTDQRGSYFRQFWDVAELVPTQAELDVLLREFLSQYDVGNIADLAPEVKENILKKYKKRLGDYESLEESERDNIVTELLEEELLEERYKDITELHTWREKRLGNNKHRPGEDLVLIIRGDLLKRYPNTVIYAVEAVSKDESGSVFQPNMPEFTGSDNPGLIKYPIFKGSLPPDVFFLGFDMSEQQAWGCKGSGWYFVLEERVSESRFGLDVPSDIELDNWDNLAWHHFGLAEEFEAYLNISERPNSGSLDTSDWNLNSSSSFISSKVLQKPVRILIHARQMLPEVDCV